MDFQDKMDWINSVLPEPFRSEFFDEVVVDVEEDDIRTLNKVFTYYIDDCQSELPDGVMDKISEKYLCIILD